MRQRGNGSESNDGLVFDPFTQPVTTTVLAAAGSRSPVAVRGIVQTVDEVPWAGGPVTEVLLTDDTGPLTLVLFGCHRASGILPGRPLVAAGVVGTNHGRRVILNPQLWLDPVPTTARVVAPEPALAWL